MCVSSADELKLFKAETVWGTDVCGHFFFYTEKALPTEEMPPPGASLETKGAPVFMTPFA